MDSEIWDFVNNDADFKHSHKRGILSKCASSLGTVLKNNAKYPLKRLLLATVTLKGPTLVQRHASEWQMCRLTQRAAWTIAQLCLQKFCYSTALITGSSSWAQELLLGKGNLHGENTETEGPFYWKDTFSLSILVPSRQCLCGSEMPLLHRAAVVITKWWRIWQYMFSTPAPGHILSNRISHH